jgi:nucleotide-binding universal stress UspA family protein
MKRTSIQRLLFATDFSEWACRAEDFACALAGSWQAHLTVMTVLEFPAGMDPEYAVNKQYLTERMRDASSRLADFKGRVQQRGIAATIRIATGIPSEEVVAAARAEETDLVIMGTKGKSGLAHVLLGSTAERAIRMAPCPVLAVHTPKPAGRPERGVSLNRILVPTDFSECSLEAVEIAKMVAHQANASIELVHILEPSCYPIDFSIEHPDQRRHKRKQATEQLETLSSGLTAAGIPVKTLLLGGAPADTILEAAEKGMCDLIVMGTHGRRGLSHVFAGSVMEAVLQRGTVPVLAVRHPAFSGE